MNDVLWELVERTPSPEEYLKIRIGAGCPRNQSLEAAKLGLPNSWFSLVIQLSSTGEAIAMGRIIGDGGLFFQVCDIAVLKEYQGRGIGKAIMNGIRTHIAKNITATGAYISLLADGEACRLYEQYGFRRTAPASLGMSMTI